MPTSHSRLSYSDCFDYLAAALADPKGICVSFHYYGDAYQLRTRLHTARVLDRKDNAEVYPPNHPLFGRSEYDELMVRLVRDGGEAAKVFIERRGISISKVTRLSEVAKVEEVVEEPLVPKPILEEIEPTERRD